MNPRKKSSELVTLEMLNHRMPLSPDEKKRLAKLEKGYQGEKKFDGMLETLGQQAIILTDLLLETNNTKFQIDSIVILQNMLYLFEVKNYEGDFYVEEDRWFTMSKREISSPIEQVNRSNLLLRQLLQQHGLHFQIKPYLLFVNDAFTLYQAPKDPTIVFPTQLSRFLENMRHEPATLGARHKKVANKLLSLRTKENPCNIEYTYDQLKKGIVCAECGGFITHTYFNTLMCSECNHVELMDKAISRSVEEFLHLFPMKKITLPTVYEWCGQLLSKKKIREVLGKHYYLIREGRASHYVRKE
ncbi:nuclease-related domain-containing protein [Aquibacillus sediminis]|uniref:nuclease-related domain-containing protein n=1 Tax=Aquibacillus sediminis TaxID=2574734 RepID=UPI001108B4F7|nr:nuclease-related domain-containing protein [Aquibacillus sediminis]